MNDAIRRFGEALYGDRAAGAAPLPSRRRAARLLDDLLEILFPQLDGEREFSSPLDVADALAGVSDGLVRLLEPLRPRLPAPPEAIAERWFADLGTLRRLLDMDAEAIWRGDPAADSRDEVVAAYPGFRAIATHRIAHALYGAGVPILPRMLSEEAHVRTGIDIHPGARIGERFCIDHGTGVVIGESTIIGDDVKIYQGVSLGAASVSKELARTKRHPTVEDRVVIYSNATVLGGRTVIGHDSVIGGNVWLTESVPPHSLVVHTGEIKVRSRRPLDDGYVDFQI